MGVELLIIPAIFVGFILWALLSGRFTKGRKESVTKEPVTLHTEPGYRPDQEGPIGEKPLSNTVHSEPTGSNAQNMP
ncbi:hypothetical protein [Xanthocytophaga agilis]|uniref:Uncharacterized protein n=1 Tax=Xanthocytophaga agilis TaxID=3048010 RepID=A0AAE3R2L9_9BACT|nr:hypothetical protein [Xanthocytophaga agilis]MDJ1500184.1 hypothetical protein [Xanthocytophaga agilis]